MNLTNQPVRQRNKYDRKREKKFTDTFRHTEYCEACGQKSDTIVPAHCNLGHDGTGWKYEGCVAGLCAPCHARSDDGTILERNVIWRQVAQKLMLDRYAKFNLTRRAK